MHFSVDKYTLKARLSPVLIATLPISLSILAWFPEGIAGWGVIWSLIAWSGGVLLFSQIGRDLGKKLEKKLFDLWGGQPTTILLRHRDSPNKHTLQRWHKKLQEILKDIRIPTIEEEENNPDQADEKYEACVAFLRQKTRDRKRFALVYEELGNYGFRRNLLGLKPIGLFATIISLIAIATLILLNQFVKNEPTSVSSIICGVINFVLLLLWIFWFNPNWVRITADAYAQRLLSSCEEI